MTTNNDSNDRKPSPQKKASAPQGRLKQEVLDAIDEEDKELIKQTLGFFKHKTGWIGQENDQLPVPVTKAPQGASEKQDKNTAEPDQEGGLAGKIIGHGKRAFSRAIFHLKAWGTGILAEVLTGLIPSSLNMPIGATALSTILGMFLLFPYHINRSATLMGIFTALLFIAAGYWPLAIAFGGLVTALIHIVNRRSAPLAFFFILPALLLCVSLGVGTQFLLTMPVWLYGGIGASIVLGILRPHWLTKIAGKLFEFSDKKQLEDVSKKTIEMEEDAQIDDEFKDFPAHVKELEKMRLQTGRLPDEMAAVVKEIKLKARAILKCMNEDPRDVMPGNQFLNRYLPMLNTTIEQFAALANNGANSVEIERTREQTLRVLSDMNDAFGQAHQRLVDNDVDDLLISLKVMDRLRKSDGYDREG